MEKGGFVPHPLVKGGNLQTLMGYFLTKQFVLPPEELLKAKFQDGVETSVLLNLPKVSTKRTPIMILLHEYGGCAEEGNISRLAKKLVQVGFRTARVNLRRNFHPGQIDDVKSVLESIIHRWPMATVTLSGLGLSGSLILNFLGQSPEVTRDYPQLVGSLAVCPALDLEQSLRLVTPFRRRLLSRVQSRVLNYEKLLVELGEEYVNLDAYFRTCSPTYTVSHIGLPTLVLATADDPVNPVKTVMKAPYSEVVTLKIEPSGGHLGFFSKRKTRFGDHHGLGDLIVNWWLDHVKIQGCVFPSNKIYKDGYWSHPETA